MFKGPKALPDCPPCLIGCAWADGTSSVHRQGRHLSHPWPPASRRREIEQNGSDTRKLGEEEDPPDPVVVHFQITK